MTKHSPEDILHSYGVSAVHGFLPTETPLRRLRHTYYEPWETLISELPRSIQDQQLRSKVHALPILQTSYLKSEEEWRRAYVILAFLTHGYFWSGERPAERLPPQLTCPFLTVSEHLGLPPTATYSATTLWNYAFNAPDCDLTDPDNLRTLQTFTGTKDEEWFYLISVALEAKGASIMINLLRCLQAVRENDSNIVAAILQSTTTGLTDLGILLERMYEKCDPQVFYHNIRPFLAGSKGMMAAGMPKGVFYDIGNGEGQWRQYSGGSNAQSSLIQFFDVVLGVDHYATGSAKSDSPAPSKAMSKGNGYLEEMKNYMPGSHRQFLSEISALANIREYAFDSSHNSGVREAYNDAVSMLSSFRDIHIKIVTRYIIMPSRMPPADYIVLRKAWNLATASSACQSSLLTETAEKPQLHGTGGTTLMPFLKQTRDETMASTI